MAAYFARRLAQLVPTFLVITLVVFILLQLAPGDPTGLDPDGLGSTVSPHALAAWRHLRGLDEPLPLQYLRWLKSFVQLDFGVSLYDERPVRAVLAEALPRTLLITGLALVTTYGISVPLGVHSALHRGSFADRAITTALFALFSLPAFWVALVLVVFLAGGEFLTLFPLRGLHSDGLEAANVVVRGFDLLWHLALPVFCLTYPSLAHVSRYQRSAMLEVMRQDYIRAARAKGLSERAVVWRHALRNSLLPVVTLFSMDVAWAFGGSVIIERIFTIRGLGMLTFEAMLRRDYPLIMGVVALAALVTMVGTLLGDLALAWLDPRVRFARRVL